MNNVEFLKLLDTKITEVINASTSDNKERAHIKQLFVTAANKALADVLRVT